MARSALALAIFGSAASCYAQFVLQPIGSGTAGGDMFGNNLALNGDGTVVAVGSSHYPGDTRFGRVVVYSCNTQGSNCTAEQTLSNATSDDQFGQSLALSADASFLVIAAYGYNVHAGAVYTFTGSPGSYASQQLITVPTGATMDEFGVSMGLSADGTILAVGAIGLSASTGGVYILSCNPATGTCGNLTLLSAPSGAGSPGDQLGWAIALSADGSTLAASANGANGGSGAVYTGSCASPGSGCALVLILPGNPGAEFGQSLAVSADGTLLAVGADQTGGGVGAAFTFSCPAGGASCGNQTLIPAAPGSPAGGRFGQAVAVSPSGASLAVGAPEAGVGATFVYTCGSTVPGALPSCFSAVPLPVAANDTLSSGALFGLAVRLSDTALVSSAPAFAVGGAGTVFAGPAPPAALFAVLQHGADFGAQLVVAPADPSYPPAPWAPSPLSAPFLAGPPNATSPLPPGGTVSLYRCSFGGSGKNGSSVPAFGFGSTPRCNVDAPWERAEVIGYAASTPAPPFVTPLWLCQTAAVSPTYGAPYYGWVPGYGSCNSSSVVALLGYVAAAGPAV